jgi:hypothetical protein
VLAFGHARRVVCGAQLLGALSCEVDLVVVFVGEDRGLESGVLPVGEAFRVGAQDRADPVERVVCAAAVAVDGLLHPPANLVDGLVPSLTTWNASSTAVASSSWSSMAFL